MKRIYALMAIVMSLVTPLALVGCGGGGGGGTTGTAMTPTPTSYTSTASPSMGSKVSALAHNHHKLVGVATAAVTLHELNKARANQMRSGHKMNFATKHPFVTAVAAGLVANHMAKKHLH